MKVVHVELGRHLYGGARQVAYLMEGLSRHEGRHVLVCQEESGIHRHLVAARWGEGTGLRAVPFRGDLDVTYAGRLRRLLREERPDLVHLHSRRGDGLSLWSARREKVPVVLSRRVDNPEPKLALWLKYPRLARVITISRGIREVLIRQGVPAEKLVCVPSAVDAERFRPIRDRAWFQEEFGVGREDLALGMVAQLIPRKGHEVLLEVAARIRAKVPQLRILIFGRGPLRESLQTRVRDGGWGSWISFPGFREDMHRVLPCLDLIVHPALTEGLGVALLESAACGVAMVASRVGGIPEIVRDGETGYLVPAGNGPSLEAAVRGLLADPEQRQRFGVAGRRLVLAEFSVPSMVAGNWQVYRQLILGNQEAN